MKTSTRHLLAPLACAAALCLALPAQAVTVTGSATSASVAQGGSTTLTLTLDVSDPIPLLGLTLTADWGTGALSVDTSSAQVFGSSLAGFAALYTDISEVSSDGHHLGVAVGALVAPFSLPAGPSTIQLSFTGLQLGAQPVHFFVELTDPSVLAEPFPLPANTSFDATVTVTAVPEPSPAALLAAGIAVLGLLARRKLR